MAVHVDIIAELQERAVKRAADRLHREFDNINVEVGADVKAAEIKAAAAKIQREFSDIRAEVKVDVDRTTLSTLAQMRSHLANVSAGAADAHRNLMTLGTTAIRTARGLGALGAAPATMILADFAKVAATATQSLWLLPAAATAAGAGIGTLKLATMGFGDAMDNLGDPEKFAEALQALSPGAQQAALSIQALLPELKGLKNATQDAFFSGVGGIGGQIEKLAKEYLPSVQNTTVGIADAFNRMIKDVGNQLLTPQTQGQLQSVMDNITQGFQNAAPAAQAFAQAFIDIVDVGSQFLPGLGTGIADMAQNIANFIREAKESGQLKVWIQDGIHAVESLVEGFKELVLAGKDLYDFFTGGSGIDDFKDDMEGLHTITATIHGDFSVLNKDIRSEFEQTTGAARTFVNFWLDIPEALASGFNWLIDRLNDVKHGIEALAKNAQGFLSVFGIDTKFTPMADIPHVPGGGDWGQLGGPTFPTGPVRAIPNRTGRPGMGPDPALSQLPGAPTGQRAVPAPPGPKQSDKDRRAAIAAGLDPSLYRVDPFAGMPQMATTGGATGPSAYGPGQGMGPVGMRYNMFGQREGFGAYAVDPQAVLEAQHKVQSEGHDLEEAKRNRLVLERDNQATAQEIEDAKWKEMEQGWQLQSAQQDLLDAQQGTWKKMKDTTKDFAKGMDDVGAALDKDFGISKGLPGLAENLVKFLGNLAFAPMMGQLSAIKAANPSQGGYGLIGMAAAQGAFGPQFTGIDPYANATTGGPTGSSQYGSAAANPFSGGLGGMAQAIGQPYGLPAGSNSGGYGGGGVQFPDWVNQLGAAFGVKPSTYSGHQESNRNEPGYAPNPQGLNRGIDWSGPADNMQRFADYLATVPQSLEQVIFQNPSTMRSTEIAGGQFQPGYYGAGTLAEHQNHVHTRQSAAIPLPGGGGGMGGPNWNAIMGAEAGGSGGWQANTGNGFYGGLQFTPSSWAAAGGTAYAQRADLATPEQQIAAGNQLLAMQGPGAWPATSAAHPEWFQTTGGSTSLPNLPAGFGGTGAPLGLGAGAGMGSPGIGGAAGIGGTYGGAGASGWSATPGVGGAAGSRIGGLAPIAPNAGGGGVGMTPGGSLDTALGVAASGLDLLAPGAGQAAQIGIKLASRAIQYAGQAAGIGVSGLMETFLPSGGSELANNSWLTRIAGGIAGASPALPNIAGGPPGQEQGQPPVAPGDVSTGQGTGPPPGPNINVEYHNNNAQPDRAHADIADRLGQISYAQPAVR